MHKLRLGFLTLAAVATLLASPGAAVATPSTERVVRAGFVIGQTSVAIEAVNTDAASQACVTIDPADAPARVLCGPAQVDVSPAMDTATVDGAINGLRFSVSFTASSAPAATADPGSDLTTASFGVARSGIATTRLIGDVFGEAEAQGSSWYAEVREKVKTSNPS